MYNQQVFATISGTMDTCYYSAAWDCAKNSRMYKAQTLFRNKSLSSIDKSVNWNSLEKFKLKIDLTTWKHYENMPNQINRKFHLQKLNIFR